MNVDPDTLEALIVEHGRTPAQQKAITKAIAALPDATIFEAPAPTLFTPKNDVAVIVLSGTGITADDRTECDAALTKFRTKHGDITVITAGHRGVEATAEKWATDRQQELVTFAPCWQLPQADGTTKYNGPARRRRTDKLVAVTTRALAAGKRVAVLAWGTEDPDDVIEQRLVAAGALPRTSSPHYRAPVTVDAPDLDPGPASEPVSIDVAAAVEAPAQS